MATTAAMPTNSSDDACADRPGDQPPGHDIGPASRSPGHDIGPASGTGPALGPGLEMEKAYTFFLELQATRYDPTRSKVETPQLPLRPKHFLQLQQLFNDDPRFASVRGKARCTYDSETGLLSVAPRTSHLHALTVDKLAIRLFREKLSVIKQLDGPTGDFARGIHPLRSSDLEIIKMRPSHGDNDDDNNIRVFSTEPDEQFSHLRAPLPGIIIEVSVSQRWEKVKDKAERLMRKAKGKVALVINIDYPDHVHSKEATVSVWRSKILQHGLGPDGKQRSWSWSQEVNQEKIQHCDGTPVITDKTIPISLHEFAPFTDHAYNGADDIEMSLSFQELRCVVHEAQQTVAMFAEADRNAGPPSEDDSESDED